MIDAPLYILDVLLSLAAVLFMLRFLLQAVRADFYNPLVQSIVSITDPVLKPLRMIMPAWSNLDFAAFVGAWAIKCLWAYTALRFGSGQDPAIITILVTGLYQTFQLVLNVFWFAILIGVIASFIAPGNYHPALQVVNALTEPLMAPVRRLLPPMGGLDFSPLVVIIGIGAVQRILPDLFGLVF